VVWLASDEARISGARLTVGRKTDRRLMAKSALCQSTTARRRCRIRHRSSLSVRDAVIIAPPCVPILLTCRAPGFLYLVAVMDADAQSAGVRVSNTMDGSSALRHWRKLLARSAARDLQTTRQSIPSRGSPVSAQTRRADLDGRRGVDGQRVLERLWRSPEIRMRLPATRSRPARTANRDGS